MFTSPSPSLSRSARISILVRVSSIQSFTAAHSSIALVCFCRPPPPCLLHLASPYLAPSHGCSLILPSLPDFTWHVVRPRSRVLVGSTLTVSGPTSAFRHPPSPPPSSSATHFHHAPAEARILPHGSDVIAKSRRDRNLDALHSGSPVFGARL